MHPAFSGVAGTYDGEVVPVITMVGSDDGTYSKFTYNVSGQVSRITHYASDSNPASDNHEDAHTVFNYAAADDATRLSETHVAAENWTGVNGVPAEVVTQYGIEGDAHTLSVVNDPNGTVYKELYGTGWQRGLTVQSQVWSGGSQQKVTTTAWMQDNTNANYQTNPRVTETNVIDSASNHSRTTIAYNTFTLPSGASCSLPADVDEYEANATTVARRTHTDYNLDTNYLNVNARLIGLPQAKFLYEGTSTLKAKSTYVYDWGGEYLQNPSAASTQHGGGYSTDFVVGRGNLVDVLRWDVTDPTNSAKALESKMGYDIDGSVVFARDALNHQNSISYGDSFSDGNNNRHTFAYPATVTDADGNSSYLQYNYDFGAKTRAQGPPPAGQSQGAIQTIGYDDAARVKRLTNANTGAYTHYVYGPNYVQSYSTVNTVAANFSDADLYAIQVFDGAGRVIGAANYHPGSAGGFSMVNTIYDLMGRAVKQSNPGEINGSWVPSGDDAAGLLYTQQTYDWKGRPLVTTNTDGTQKYVSYTACGCAGSEVTTLTDEVGRQQKIYSDVFGRTAKTEVLNWDSSVYSTTVNTYNARDQVSLVRQYQGTDQTSVYQDTTMSYDGYGRLQFRHVPEQSASTATTYAYNADDTLYSVTDGRGAIATYGYNNRHLVTGISYSVPYGVGTTPNVSFGYDAAGNRTSMTDGLGSVSYNYDQLSRLTSEGRYFNTLGQSFTVSYQYNLANELTVMSDPFGATLNYAYDSTARLNSVNGSGYGSVTQFASNMKYRAWGGLKGVNYDSIRSLTINYNSRMNPTLFGVGGQYYTVGSEYQYYADGRISYSRDLTDGKFDRSYSYDHITRLTSSFSGSEARGVSVSDGPYRQTYDYDSWGNLTRRTGRDWSHNSSPVSFTYDSSTNRNSGWQYDAEGNVIGQGTLHYSFDANGQQVGSSQTGGSAVSEDFDGDGRRVRKTYPGWVGYTLRSTALNGAVVAELNSQGQPWRRYIYANGQVLAELDDVYHQVGWVHRSPSNNSEFASGSGSIGGLRANEYDPLAHN